LGGKGHKLTPYLMVFYIDLSVLNIRTTDIMALCDKVSVVIRSIGLEFWYVMPLSTIYQLWQSVILVEETDVSAENYRHFIT
jgi:hypothetical protein